MEARKAKVVGVIQTNRREKSIMEEPSCMEETGHIHEPQIVWEDKIKEENSLL